MDDSLPEFCLSLKAARERKGITLDEIAAATKIPVSMFEALERSDLRFWPKGLFGRSFFRAYVGMIGVKTDEACAEFVRLFSGAQPTELPPALDQSAHSDAPSPPKARRSLLDALATFFSSSTSTASTEAEPQKSEQPRAWTTDARRVSEPRMRVRIKFK